MKRNTLTGIKVWLVIGGVVGSVAAGLGAANYAVGGIDPFYRNAASAAWAAERHDDNVDIARRDDFLPSIGADPAPIPATTTAATMPDTSYNDRDWVSDDAQAQRDFDRSMQLAEAPAYADPLPPASAPPIELVGPTAAPLPPPPLQQGGNPVTPNHSLIY